jgi:hypothetical protein
MEVAQGHVEPGERGYAFMLIASVSAFLIFCAWVALMLPLALFLSPQAKFWTWPVSTICGGIAGSGIMLALSRMWLEGWPYDVAAAVVGAVALSIMSLRIRGMRQT